MTRKTVLTERIAAFELRPVDGQPLAPFSAGAHVTVLTPNLLTRRYSLCNAPHEADHYLLAVQREPQGLGGSIGMVDLLHEGDVLPVSQPRNDFPLVAGASGAAPSSAWA